jgi:protein-disulfide isomerase
MFRRFLAATGLTLGLALPAQALDLDDMSKAERETFRAEVRAYLLDNPEVIMEAVSVLESREQQAQMAQDRDLIAANRDALLNSDHSWSGGNPDGDITLVEFIDYRCGYCRRAFDEVEQLVDIDGDIRLILKEFPILGEQSEMASRFAIATLQVAGDDAYKAVHDALMTMTGPVNETTLRRLVEPLGHDADAIIGHMEGKAVTEVLDANDRLAANLRISGTPSFVMNDKMLRGYLPLDAMLQLVDEVRAQ